MADWGIQYYSDTLGRLVDLGSSTAYEYMATLKFNSGKGYEGWSHTFTFNGATDSEYQNGTVALPNMPTGGELVAFATAYQVPVYFEYGGDPDYTQLDVKTHTEDSGLAVNQVYLNMPDVSSYNHPNDANTCVHVFCKMPAPTGDWGIQTAGDFSLITDGSKGLFLNRKWSGSQAVNSNKYSELLNGVPYLPYASDNIYYFWTSDGNAVINFHGADSIDSDWDGTLPIRLDVRGNDVSTVTWYLCEFTPQAPKESEWGVEIYNASGQKSFTTEMIPFQWDVNATLPPYGNDDSAPTIGTTMMIPVTCTGWEWADNGDDMTLACPTNVGGKLVQRRIWMSSTVDNNDHHDKNGIVIHCTDYKNYF